MAHVPFDVARRIFSTLAGTILILGIASSTANADISSGLRDLLQGVMGVDLRVDSFALNKGQATIGETLRATVGISNAGKAAATSTVLTLWAGPGSSPSTANAFRLATVRLGTLQPLTRITSVSTFPVPNFGRAGAYQIFATVESSASEANRQNNTQAKSLMVIGPAVSDTDSQPASDSEGSSAPPPPSPPVAGGGSSSPPASDGGSAPPASNPGSGPSTPVAGGGSSSPPASGGSSSPPPVASNPGSGSSSPPAPNPGSGSSSPQTPPETPPSFTCHYYASPNGRGTGTTPESPFRISSFWAVASPGKTLCLLDGTYSGSDSMIDPPDGMRGTANAPITIRALHDGKVLIDGQSVRQPVALRRGNSWWVIQGINARESNANGAIDMSSGSSNNIIRRVVAWNTQTGGFPIIARGSSGASVNNLIEDSAFFGLNRKACGMLSTAGMNTTWRRVWCRWEGSNSTTTSPTGPKMAFTGAYNSNRTGPKTGTVAENVIGTWTGERGCADAAGNCPSRYGLLTADGDLTTSTAPGDKVKFYGSLGYLKLGASFADTMIFGGAGTNQDGYVFQDVVAYVVGYSGVPALRFGNCTPDCVGNVAQNVIGIGGRTSSISSEYSGTNRFTGATLGDVPNPYNGISGGPLCFEYVNGVKTKTAMWPWRMDNRIRDALVLAGSSRLSGTARNTHAAGTVTSEIESLLGRIPDVCYRSASEAPRSDP